MQQNSTNAVVCILYSSGLICQVYESANLMST